MERTLYMLKHISRLTLSPLAGATTNTKLNNKKGKTEDFP